MTTEFVNFGFKGVFARSVAKYNKKKKVYSKSVKIRKLVHWFSGKDGAISGKELD